jgi:5-methylthioadenosine/S-adenosylhomocysteine deaminase
MLRLFASLLFIGGLLSAEAVDWLYTARYVVTMDPQRRLIVNGAVAIRADRIVAVGTSANLARHYQARQRIDRPDALMMPGLINTHTHAPMSLLRGIADDLNLQDWLTKYIFPAEAKNVDREFVNWGTRLACLEMMLSGTTTFVDMYYFEDKIAEATKAAGLRAVLGETIIGFPDPDSKTPADGLKYTEDFIQRYKSDPLIVPAVAPHALYTNSDETLKACRALANRYDVPLVIHLSETKHENDEARAKRHLSPTEILDSIGVLSGRTIAAHGIWLNGTDMGILAKRKTGVAHCPSSNMKLASGIAPVMKLIDAGVPVGLGTDGPAGSNNDFDMFEEMNLAADLQKVSTMNPQALPAMKAIEMATIDGARVTGLEKQIGSLEVGKRADLITVRLDRPHAVPMYNVYSQIVYALKGSDVQDVVVNGRLIVRDGHSLTLNESEILRKANEYSTRISASIRTR